MLDLDTAAAALFPGVSLRLDPVEDTGGFVQFLTLDSGARYVLKCFEGEDGSMVEREAGMRACLRESTDIEFPEILDVAEIDGDRYMLMEHIEGERLDTRWRNDPSIVPDGMARLGALMGEIHAIPLEQAQRHLSEDPSIYTESFFAQASASIAPFLTPDERAALSDCHRIVNDGPLEQVVLHGDFAPLQVIVRPDGRWVLFDFEFAMLGPFADDLAGAEVRMERLGFPNAEPFLTAYENVQPRLAAYEPVRAAYKAYLLLTILSTAITRDEETPTARDLERLRHLLSDLA
jgi:aminoglycoside phosphotransferase (APT) family kinase protein